MRFSVGMLYSAVDFLRLVMKTGSIDPEFSKMFRTFAVADPQLVLELVQRADWVRLNADGYFVASQQGIRIMECDDEIATLRLQLSDLISTLQPPWLPLLSRGRQEATACLPSEVRQCLREAHLLGDIDDRVVEWWDQVASNARQIRNEKSMVTGRSGERLSIEYELNRTGLAPKWQAVESNLAGYDLISIWERGDPRRLLIEVKTSDSTFDDSRFYVSKNEWFVASSSPYYVFHLWTLRPTPSLRVVYPDQIEQHIPRNRAMGEWQTVTIPFAVFGKLSEVKAQESNSPLV